MKTFKYSGKAIIDTSNRKPIYVKSPDGKPITLESLVKEKLHGYIPIRCRSNNQQWFKDQGYPVEVASSIGMKESEVDLGVDIEVTITVNAKKAPKPTPQQTAPSLPIVVPISKITLP